MQDNRYSLETTGIKSKGSINPTKATVLWITCLTLVTAGCSSEFSPPFLNYQQCKKEMTAKYIAKGNPKIKAELDARDYCRDLFK